ncbi:hypothetical protein SBRY_50862 [Actinacidiphila bryophytorum]|uniref:Uncharacterized protein n=1 Tax=Actinacidiphila bryophytorum TaxID=1436133 RepID=A0A9W4MJR5_9ACTN|nr:hypothetical protein SBRY_50862 [Actinacidiphila bryophytorum]
MAQTPPTADSTPELSGSSSARAQTLHHARAFPRPFPRRKESLKYRYITVVQPPPPGFPATCEFLPPTPL